MADISIISRLVNGYNRNVDVSQNALVVGSIKIGSSSPVEITKTIATKLLAIQAAADADGTFDTRYTKITDLASTANGKGASSVGVEDAAGNFTSTTVEGVLAELYAAAGSGAAADVTYDNATSGLTATNVQDAIDEVEGRVDATEIVANAAIPLAQKGAANGVATLDANQVIPIGQIPAAALERLVIVADEAARFALTTAVVQNGDTVKQADTEVMYFVKDDTNLDSALGYSVYAAGTAAAVEWSGVLNTPTTVAGYGIADFDSSARAAAVADSITDGVTDIAPSQNAVFDALALKAPINNPTFTGTVNGITKAMVGLGNVDNTADADKNVATAKSLVSAEFAGEALDAATIYAMRFGRAADAGFVAGRMYKADVDSSIVDNFDVMGLTINAGAISAADPISLVMDGDLIATAHGFTIGEALWLNAGGVISNTPPTNAIGTASVKVGTVKDANTIKVKVQIMNAG